MKKLLAALLLTLPSLSQAAIIYTDEALFLADYESPTSLIDFATAIPSRAPVQTSGNIETLHSDSFSSELLFETRRAGDLGWAWGAIDRLNTGGPIFATDLPYTEGERIGISTIGHKIVALQTTAGFFGWVPELGGIEINDFLFLLPIDAQVQSAQWGFTAKPVEAPEPAPFALLLAGLAAIIFRKSKTH
jgi:hypothetical protein